MKKRRLMSLVLATALSFSIAVPAYAVDDTGGGDDTSQTLPTDNIGSTDGNNHYSGKFDIGGKNLIDIIGDLFGPFNPPTEDPPVTPPSPNDDPSGNPSDTGAPDESSNPSGQIDEEDEELPNEPIISNDPDKNPPPTENTKPKHTKYSVDGLNFFVNLKGDILDTTDSSGHYSSALFTSALTSKYNIDGNDLEDDVVESDYYSKIGSYYDAILGDADEYEDVDAEIRDILSNHITMPTDSAILDSIKTQISNGTKINDINGEMVYDTLVSTDYYNVYWYVLKEGVDYWHVDGILEKKSQPLVNTYDVTYSWTTTSDLPIPSALEVPEKVTYAENDPVTPDTVFYDGYTYEDATNDGTWEFSGWSITESFNITEDTEITGEWVFTANATEPPCPPAKTYSGSYEWTVNGGPGLPSTVIIPDGESHDYPFAFIVNSEYYKDCEVPVTGGKYVFSGWSYGDLIREPNEQIEINDDTGESIVLRGSWEWVEDTTPDPIQYNFTITYVDKHGTMFDKKTGTINAGDSWFLYNYIPTTLIYSGRDLEYYTGEVEGENCSADVDIVAVYSRHYSLKVNYIDADTGTELQKAYSHVVSECSDWDISNTITSKITYNDDVYIWSVNEGDSLIGSDIHNNINITAKYQKKSAPIPTPPDTPSTPSKKTYYKIEVEFVDSNGNEISDDYSTTVRKNHAYDVTNKIPDTIMVGDQEYILKTTTGDPLNGIANCNKKITAWYDLKVTVPPEEDETIIVIPPVETPEPPVETPEETPEPPTQPEEPKIDDTPKPEEPKDTPKIDDVPKTGEPVSLSLAVATLIGTLGTMGFINRKKKDEDQ